MWKFLSPTLWDTTLDFSNRYSDIFAVFKSSKINCRNSNIVSKVNAEESNNYNKKVKLGAVSGSNITTQHRVFRKPWKVIVSASILSTHHQITSLLHLSAVMWKCNILESYYITQKPKQLWYSRLILLPTGSQYLQLSTCHTASWKNSPLVHCNRMTASYHSTYLHSAFLG